MRNLESDLMGAISRGTHKALTALSLIAQTDAQRRVLSGPKTGRIYRRGRANFHRASAPGEAPANDFGFLVGSIKLDVTQELNVKLRAVAPYAVHLEYGTKNMAARPFLRPAGEFAGREAGKVFNAYLQEELR